MDAVLPAFLKILYSFGLQLFYSRDCAIVFYPHEKLPPVGICKAN